MGGYFYVFHYYDCLCTWCIKGNKGSPLMLAHLEDIFGNYFEMTYLVPKIEQVDILKKIILNEGQIAIFNYISSYTVNLDGEFIYNKKLKIVPKNYWKDNTKKFSDYYDKIKKIQKMKQIKEC